MTTQAVRILLRLLCERSFATQIFATVDHESHQFTSINSQHGVYRHLSTKPLCSTACFLHILRVQFIFLFKKSASGPVKILSYLKGNPLICRVIAQRISVSTSCLKSDQGDVCSFPRAIPLADLAALKMKNCLFKWLPVSLYTPSAITLINDIDLNELPICHFIDTRAYLCIQSMATCKHHSLIGFGDSFRSVISPFSCHRSVCDYFSS